ncbi:MAG: elongation factor P maturation arginine rhamnosyltransferase EarP, partial [Variovorax sp.]
LWIDDASALRWMAPDGRPGVALVDWSDESTAAAAAQTAPDVVIEAFGCEPAPDLIARFAQRATASGAPPSWINLEYLSAEPYVERLHRLPSPIFKGPGAGLTRHFFYPGFTPATGGLLREADIDGRQAGFDRAAWLAEHGIPWNGERLVTLFCYEPPALPALLAQFETAAQPTRLLVTAGRAASALPPGPEHRGALSISWLPPLPQAAFDRLLWSCALNFVRGEDSLVRALWAGEPFVWQIYPQDDDVHHAKLEAFLTWLGAPASLHDFHRGWNGIAPGPLPELTDSRMAEWRDVVQAARARLLAQDDLVTQLRRFVGQSG